MECWREEVDWGSQLAAKGVPPSTPLVRSSQRPEWCRHCASFQVYGAGSMLLKFATDVVLLDLC